TSPHTRPTAATTAERICAEPPRSPPQLRRGPHGNRKCICYNGRTTKNAPRVLSHSRGHPPTDQELTGMSKATTSAIGGCERSAHARGLCNTHYVAARRAAGLPPRPPAQDRF